MPLNADKDFLIVALDFPEMDQALELVDLLEDDVSFYKVGMELFYKAHFSIIKELKKREKKIFLDLKLNDIPRTIAAAVKIFAKEEVDYITLFTSGLGIQAAREVLDQDFSWGEYERPKIFNVTVLTSETQEPDTEKTVLERSQLTFKAGGDGIICSGLETAQVKKQTSKNFMVINPGVRPQGSRQDDQKRIVTPQEARQAGADHIVVGRPIRESKNPKETVREILSLSALLFCFFGSFFSGFGLLLEIGELLQVF